MSTPITSMSMYARVTKADNLVVVKCWAGFCKPCIENAPAYDEMARQHPHAAWYTVDIESIPDFAESEGISRLPSYLIFRAHEPVGMIIGASNMGEIPPILI